MAKRAIPSTIVIKPPHRDFHGHHVHRHLLVPPEELTIEHQYPVVIHKRPQSKRHLHRVIWVDPFRSPMAKRYMDGRGLYRVFNAAEFELWRKLGSPPDIDADSPFATAASLPDTPADVYADGTWYLALTYTNGVIRSGFYPVGPAGEAYHIITVAGGVALATPPQGGVAVELQDRANGVTRVIAYYLPWMDGDTNRADDWAITFTIDGSPPAEDAPDVVQAMQKFGGSESLVYDLPAQLDGTTVKVRVQTRRDGSPDVYSDGSAILTTTADAVGPAAPGSADRWPGLLPEDF